eukprot:CAMPEP_0197693626 /NCGR_PEP_ID=MMETSP1338-20131121/112764_1 /TAXON_ID=43686 ORGANISM="Pelagodinium beii, Strain RCC1491" /NCGR_SAMPLE_ID=MMETSP1338 /ASSEMBLY_ACC=CAM_ASM_000754 /LENGTH=79 /DNA_ID=CAMNT_0043276399 /DNA_START=401 /DNA_END=640 /DNA_ORIENTATION=-
MSSKTWDMWLDLCSHCQYNPQPGTRNSGQGLGLARLCIPAKAEAVVCETEVAPKAVKAAVRMDCLDHQTCRSFFFSESL